LLTEQDKRKSKKQFAKENVLEKWNRLLGQKREQLAAKANLSDFGRFKVMVARKRVCLFF